jgi:3-hydroxyacyl-[acyl-carrier-protein] dehydratase
MQFYLIDRVTEFVPEKSATGIKAVSLSEDIFRDHFPVYPVMPGVLMIEGAAQLSGFLLESSQPRTVEVPVKRALLSKIDKAKFYDMVRPGDRLTISVTILSHMETAALLKAHISVEDKLAARAELTFVLKDIPYPEIHSQREALYRIWTRDLDGQHA